MKERAKLLRRRYRRWMQFVAIDLREKESLECVRGAKHYICITYQRTPLRQVQQWQIPSSLPWG